MDITHVVELILKERIRRIHPAFVWENIDKYPISPEKTIGIDKAVNRLLNLGGIALSDSAKKTLLKCKEIRNSIIHFEFEINFKEAKVIIGRILSFVFDFGKHHLNLDFEKEFRKDDRWIELLNIYEFWEEHSITIEKQLEKEGKYAIECPSCSANTFVLNDMKCALCNHLDSEVECGICKTEIWESQAEIIEGIDGNEDSGVYPYSITICRNCLEGEVEKQNALESQAEELKDIYINK